MARVDSDGSASEVEPLPPKAKDKGKGRALPRPQIKPSASKKATTLAGRAAVEAARSQIVVEVPVHPR